MFWLILRRLAQSAVLLAPFSFVVFLKCGATEKTFPWLPVFITLAALTLDMLMDVVEFFSPQLSVAHFRDAYLREKLDEWYTKLPPGVRVNVMYAKRCWYLLFLVSRFTWTENRGFDPPRHHDLKLILFSLQGVCGKAYRKRSVWFADLRDSSYMALSRYRRWLPFNKFRLWQWQMRKTEEVGLKYVLSIPMLRKVGTENNPHWNPVGIINIDATTAADADLLAANKDTIASWMTRDGQRLALLPVGGRGRA